MREGLCRDEDTVKTSRDRVPDNGNALAEQQLSLCPALGIAFEHPKISVCGDNPVPRIHSLGAFVELRKDVGDMPGHDVEVCTNRLIGAHLALWHRHRDLKDLLLDAGKCFGLRHAGFVGLNAHLQGRP